MCDTVGGIVTVWVEESLRRGMEVQSADGTAMLTSTLFGRVTRYQVNRDRLKECTHASLKFKH